MTAVRHIRVKAPLLFASLLIGCDKVDSLAPTTIAAPSAARLPAPAQLVATPVSASKIALTWLENSNNESGFEVHRSTTGSGGTFALRAKTGAEVTAYGDEGLSAMTEYCYKVRTFRTTGGGTNYSAFSGTACVTTPAPPVPAAPSGTDARPGSSTAADVSWIDRSTSEDGFRVERSVDGSVTWSSAALVGRNASSYRDGARVSEQLVCYRVIAFNTGGDSPPSSTDCTTPPAAPSGLIATNVDGSGVDLNWTDNSGVEDGYVVRRIFANGYTSVDLPPNTTSYRDGTPTADVTYQVWATNDGGYSDGSNTATVAGSCPVATVEQCSNGVDDDCDGFIDTDDIDCQCWFYPCPLGYSCDPWSAVCLPDPYCGDDEQTADVSGIGNRQPGGQP